MQRLPNCNRRDARHTGDDEAGSAGGPKPGRTSFSVKLGGGRLRQQPIQIEIVDETASEGLT
jgi:hypothetical protein